MYKWIERQGISIIGREHTFDEGIIDCVICANEYRLPERIDGIVLDIGAHIGAFSRFAAHRGASVYGYEAHPLNAPIFTANALMALANNQGCFPHWCAVTGQKVDYTVGVPRTFPRQWDMQNTGGLGIALKQGDMLDVPTCTIADLPNAQPTLPETPPWRWEQVTLIKMDVEGAEYEILEHLPYRVPKIVGEYHLVGQYNSHEAAQNALQSFLPGYSLEFSYDAVHMLGLFFATSC